MAAALIPLQNITLGSAAASVSFGSIPNTFKDLRLVFSGTSSSGADDVVVQLNGDTAYNYSRVYMWGNGSTTGSASVTGANVNALKVTYYGSVISSEIANIEIDFMDYSATDKHKTYMARCNRAGSGVDANVSRWASTAAVTSVLLKPSGSNFAAGSTFALYGVKA